VKFLFVHHSFPGQCRHIVRALASQSGNEIVGLGINSLSAPVPKNVRFIQYSLKRGNTSNIHPWLVDVDSKLIRAEACARAADELHNQGFVPDIICAHPGWGESLFLKDIWPYVPLLTYQEFFYHAHGFDCNFDEELQGKPDWKACASVRVKKANLLLNLEASNWNVTPIFFSEVVSQPVGKTTLV